MLLLNDYLFLLFKKKSYILNFSFRDIAGHERFGQMTRVYYKYALVYSQVTSYTCYKTKVFGSAKV